MMMMMTLDFSYCNTAGVKLNLLKYFLHHRLISPSFGADFVDSVVVFQISSANLIFCLVLILKF